MKNIRVSKNLKAVIIRITLLILFILILGKICYGQSDTSYRKTVVENFINQVNDELTAKGLDTVETTYDAFNLYGTISIGVWTSRFKGDDFKIIDDEYERYFVINLLGIDQDEYDRYIGNLY